MIAHASDQAMNWPSASAIASMVFGIFGFFGYIVKKGCE